MDTREIKQTLAMIAWLGLIFAFFIGVLEGYTGNYIDALQPVIAIAGLLILAGSVGYFYLEGKEYKQRKQDWNYLIFALAIACYELTGLGWVAILMVIVPYLVGKIKA